MQITYQSGDVIEPQFIADINRICDISKEFLEKEKWKKSELPSDGGLINLIDELILLFEKIYPSV